MLDPRDHQTHDSAGQTASSKWDNTPLLARIAVYAVVLAMIFAVPVSPFLWFGVWGSKEPDYRSGDRPQVSTITKTHSLCFNEDGGCGNFEDVIAYRWPLGPDQRSIATTFRPADRWYYPGNDPLYSLAGSLEHNLHPKDCEGASVQWAFIADGRTIASGTLDAETPHHRLDERVPRHPREVRLTARRLDAYDCNTILTWDDPGITGDGLAPNT